MLNVIKLRLRNAYLRKTSNIRKKKIKYDDFTIISNNCWAGIIYESYNLPKLSPTVGMYFTAEEYIKFASNLKHYIEDEELKFISPENAKHKEYYKKDKGYGTYPIGILGDVEIAFLHYHSEEEAKQKWNKRCQRVNWNRLIVKMNDQNDFSHEYAMHFTQLPFKNKIFFTTREDCSKLECALVVSSRYKECCGMFDEPYGASKKFDVNHYVNTLE